MTEYDMQGFVTKDSGERRGFASGMRRDIQASKERFDLLTPKNVPYHHTMVYRDAMLATRGAQKYEPRNNELACTQEELDSFLESACRHFEKWKAGMDEEDEAAAARWNIRQYEETMWRIENGLWPTKNPF